MQSVLAILGLVPTALVLLGLARILRDPRRHGAWMGPLIFSAAILVSLLGYTWTLPHYSAVKASYLLPAVLPVSYLLCIGLEAIGGRALTWYGWWL
jgi:hypothetical protein